MGIMDSGSVLGDSSRPRSSSHDVLVCPSPVSASGGQVLAEPMAGGGQSGARAAAVWASVHGALVMLPRGNLSWAGTAAVPGSIVSGVKHKGNVPKGFLVI